MGPLERELAQRRGRRKLDAMKRRAGQLRRRVVAAAVIGFALLWTVVFVQMATGNDPALKPSAATGRPAARESGEGVAPDPERRRPRTAVPPPGEATERAEAERVEAERREAEALELAELEELEALSTGQS